MWVTVCEERTYGEEDLGDGQGGAPVLLENIQTDGALRVHVTVVDSGPERHLKWKK